MIYIHWLCCIECAERIGNGLRVRSEGRSQPIRPHSVWLQRIARQRLPIRGRGAQRPRKQRCLQIERQFIELRLESFELIPITPDELQQESTPLPSRERGHFVAVKV